MNGSVGSETNLPRGLERLVSCRRAGGRLWNGLYGHGRAGIRYGWEGETPNNAALWSLLDVTRIVTSLNVQSRLPLPFKGRVRTIKNL